MFSKLVTAAEAASLIGDGMVVSVSSSSGLGCPDLTLRAIRERFGREGHPRDLTTLHPIAAMEAPVSLERFWGQPWRATVIWCKGSANPPRAHQRRTADRLDARWLELDTGHYPMLTAPDELARMIMAG